MKWAIEELRRVLVPGGQVVVSTWGKPDQRWEWLDGMVKKYLPPEPEAKNETQPGSDFRTPTGVEAILTAGGFHFLRDELQTEEITYRSEAEWWATNWSHGFRQALEEIEQKAGSAGLERYRVEAFDHLQAFRAAEGFPQQLGAVFAARQKKNENARSVGGMGSAGASCCR